MIFGKYGIFFSGKPKKKKQDLHSSFTTENFKDLGSFSEMREHSFMNFNTNPDQSFQDEMIPTINSDEGSPRDADLHITHSPMNQNFTAIMNAPSKRGSFFIEFYNTISETLKESWDSKGIQKNSAVNENITYNDFLPYIHKIKASLDSFEAANRMKELEEKNKDFINYDQALVDCYKEIPASYFDQRFIFNFKLLKRNINQMNEIHNNLTEHLDVVELNLFYQIKNRFKQFFDTILNLNHLEKDIMHSIELLEGIKSSNRLIKTNLFEKSEKILRLKRRFLNTERTLYFLELLNTVKMTVPTLNELIKSSNYEYAVNLIKTSENIYYSKLMALSSLQDFSQNFKQAKTILDKNLSGELFEKALPYFQDMLVYSKSNPSALNGETSILEETFLTQLQDSQDSYMNSNSSQIEDSTIKASFFPWTLSEQPIKTAMEEEISSMLSHEMIICDFNFRGFKVKILESLKNFQKQFLKDLFEYLDIFNNGGKKEAAAAGEANSGKKPGVKTQNVSEVIQGMNFGLFRSFILFYFRIYERLFKRETSLLFLTLEKYLRLIHSDPSGPDINNDAVQKKVAENCDEIFSIIIMICKFMSDKISEILIIKSCEGISIDNFGKYISIFDAINEFVEKELKVLKPLKLGSEENLKSGIKLILNKLQASTNKVSISSLTNLRLDCEKTFLNSFHKQKLNQLKQTLEEELWVPVDVPYSDLPIFKYFYQHLLQNSVKKPGEEPASEIDALEKLMPERSSSVQLTGEEGAKEEKEDSADESRIMNENMEREEAAPDLRIKILKQEIEIFDQKFKVNASGLFMIRLLYDYLYISENFKGLSDSVVAKLLEATKFFNSYTCQLVLGAACTNFERIKTITAKILAISMISLKLIANLFEIAFSKIKLGPFFTKAPRENESEQQLKLARQAAENEYSTISHELEKHLTETQNKLRSIFYERLIVQTKNLEELNWGTPDKFLTPSKPSAHILTALRQIISEIDEILPENYLNEIFTGMFNDIIEVYLVFFRDIDIKVKISAERIVGELEYFLNSVLELSIMTIIPLQKENFQCIVRKLVDDLKIKFSLN